MEYILTSSGNENINLKKYLSEQKQQKKNTILKDTN